MGEEETTTATTTHRTRPSRPWALIACLSAIGASSLGATWSADSRAEAAAERFLTAANERDGAASREALSPGASLRLTPGELAGLTDAPIFSGAYDIVERSVETWGGPPVTHACVALVLVRTGEAPLRGDGERWGVEMSLERADEEFQVEDLAVLPPDAAPRHHLLDACGPRAREQR